MKIKPLEKWKRIVREHLIDFSFGAITTFAIISLFHITITPELYAYITAFFGATGSFITLMIRIFRK